ncbi:MAG: gliding motility-associated C-terminal domain-containing protein [Cytophagaceae bacterium]|jgi:hypothetical protein|nr:gliding motility-associated C-terminal domain-containing protein [Cytophagaceae bacterium]
METEITRGSLQISQFAFYPSVEAWLVPVKTGKSGILEINNRHGQLIYSAQITRTGECRWDGTSASGLPMPAGVYQYVLRYNDNSLDTGTVELVY